MALSHANLGNLHTMNALFLATEAASYPGDDLQVVAWALAGTVFVVAAITTIVITPKASNDGH